MSRSIETVGYGVSRTEFESEALERADAALFEALLAANVAALEEILADEFLIVDVAGGSVYRREAFLEAIGDGVVKFEEIKAFTEEAVIRFAGPDAGLIVGRTAMAIRDAEGNLNQVASRYTHVFQRQGNAWRLFSAQGTPIV
jgi:ketosteroid isomerase-like protein